MRGPGRLRRARGGVFTSVLALAAGTLCVASAAAPPAAALTPPVGFTADALPTYQTNGIVWSLAEANGVVYAGGTFTGIRPAGSPAGSDATSAVNFAAFDAATGAPTGCSLSFTRNSGTATVRALAVSPDKSTLYVGGYFNAVSGTAVNGLAAVDTATCRPRTGFAPQFGATVRALDVAQDGTVYAGGDFQTVNGTARRFFGAVTAGGALTGWNPAADEPGRTLRVTPDGNSVLIGGDFFTVGGTASHALAVTSASSDPTAGSAESHSIVPVTGTWTESAVTYNSRPALSTSVLGTITGASSVSTGYSADLDATALGGALGSVSSLALTSSGTDSLRIWSSEATAAFRPQIVLTFGAE